jgi:hypothetical protein
MACFLFPNYEAKLGRNTNSQSIIIIIIIKREVFVLLILSKLTPLDPPGKVSLCKVYLANHNSTLCKDEKQNINI